MQRGKSITHAEHHNLTTPFIFLNSRSKISRTMPCRCGTTSNSFITSRQSLLEFFSSGAVPQAAFAVQTLQRAVNIGRFARTENFTAAFARCGTVFACLHGTDEPKPGLLHCVKGDSGHNHRHCSCRTLLQRCQRLVRWMMIGRSDGEGLHGIDSGCFTSGEPPAEPEHIIPFTIGPLS